MQTAYKDFWNRYLDFKGRSSRSDYWWVFLINSIIYLVLMATFLLSSGLAVALTADVDNFLPVTWMALIVLMVWAIASIIPMSSLAMRRIRDAGLSPFLWFVFPADLILGELTQTWAMIISGLLAVVYFVFTLLPSKQEKVAPYSQIRGSLIVAVGLVAVIAFSLGHIPAKAEQIMAAQPHTELNIKTVAQAKIDISGLSAQDKQDIYSLYKEQAWKLSDDGNSLVKDISSENLPVTINNKTYQANSDGDISIKVPSATRITVSTPNAPSSVDSVIGGKKGADGSVKISKNENQTISVTKTINVNAALSEMDQKDPQQKPMNTMIRAIPVIPLASINLSPPKKYVGKITTKKVSCNDFNGPKSDGKYHGGGLINDLTNKQFLQDFYQSDCYYVVNMDFIRYFNTCRKDNLGFGQQKYCRNLNGACSVLQQMPKTYHNMKPGMVVGT